MVHVLVGADTSNHKVNSVVCHKGCQQAFNLHDFNLNLLVWSDALLEQVHSLVEGEDGLLRFVHADTDVEFVADSLRASDDVQMACGRRVKGPMKIISLVHS